jgi:predicted Zn-dependent protease
MDRMSAQKPPELLSTHPASRNRMEELRAMLPEMERLYRQAPVQYGLGVRLPEVSPTAASDRAAPASP